MGYYSGLLGFVQNQQGLGENQRQFNANFGENQRQFDNQFLEGQRTFDNQFVEGQRRYDNDFLEGQRQFDTGIGEQARQFNLGFGQDYDQLVMQYLPMIAQIDQGLFARDADTFNINQGEMQRQFSNNAGLLGFMPQGGNSAPIDVRGAYGLSSQQANAQAQADAQRRQQQMQTTAAIAQMAIMAFSSRDFKDKTGDISGEEALKAVMALPVDRWKYKGSEQEHIGTYAEDFAEQAGVGDGKTIHMLDYLGVLTAAVQEIARRAGV